MKKLTKKFKRDWVKALRSGKYKQGQRTLLRDNKYCCLGVACVVAGVKNVPRSPVISEFSKRLSVLPEILKGGINYNRVVNKLVDMNDVRRKSFNEIADWIEENL